MAERGVGEHAAVLFGIVLVIAGTLLTGLQLTGVRLFEVSWPVVVIVPGLLLLVAAFSVPPGRGLGYLAIPGCIVLVTGVVLEVQAVTGDWQSWSYAWALVAPGAVGLGLLIAGMRERAAGVRKAGALLIAIAAALFATAEWLFVRVLQVGGPGLAYPFGLVFPALVVVFGLYFIVRGLARGR